MVTVKTQHEDYYDKTGQWKEYVGLSTDSKPTNQKNGTSFLEMDTGKVFLYDEQHKQWIEV